MFLSFLLRESAILLLNRVRSRASITADGSAKRPCFFFAPRSPKLREEEARALGAGAFASQYARANRFSGDRTRQLVWTSLSWTRGRQRRNLRHGKIDRRSSHSPVRNLGSRDKPLQ